MFIEETKAKGTYVGVRFHKQLTSNPLRDFILNQGIPNPLSQDKFHSTVIFSRKYIPAFRPSGQLISPITGRFVGYDVWQGSDGKNALVMLYDSPRLVQRHRDIMDAHDATYDFDEYKPHITLSYDVGDNFDISKLQQFTKEIMIVEEYVEDLNLDWDSS